MENSSYWLEMEALPFILKIKFKNNWNYQKHSLKLHRPYMNRQEYYHTRQVSIQNINNAVVMSKLLNKQNV